MLNTIFTLTRSYFYPDLERNMMCNMLVKEIYKPKALTMISVNAKKSHTFYSTNLI